MTSNPKVSIIIPVFNGEKYLEECIESALNQTHHNLEIIAVDDGSRDNSLEILKKYSDKIKIIQKKNGGTASALNKGIEQATGEWIKWLSQDDVLYPISVEKLVKKGNELENKKKCIIISNYHIIDNKGKIIEEFKQIIPHKKTHFDFNVVLLDHYIGNVNTSLIHKSAFEEFGLFDESNDILPDYELWLRFCLIFGVKIILIPEFLLKYRVHKNSFTESTPQKEWDYLNLHVKKHVLGKLSQSEQLKYEKALKKYRRIFKIKKILLVWLNFLLPKKIVLRIQDTYRNK